MLRRKLFYNLGPLVVLLLITSVAAIWLLQGVLRDLNYINSQAWGVVEHVNALNINVNAIEVDLYELQLDKQRHLDTLIDKVESTRQIVQTLGSDPAMTQPQVDELYQRILAQLPQFEQHVSALATAQDAEAAKVHREATLATVGLLRQSMLPLGRAVRDQAHQQQEELFSWFRGVVLGLSLVFLIVVNVAVVVLLRLGSMVLQPVDCLVEATRQLGAEHFDYRVKLDGKDEFDELAGAYNSLAAQLQTNDRKRIETLAQVAVTVNHELNNAITIIDLQLAKVSRQASSNPGLASCLRQIHDSLQRVTHTVQSLKNIRRIVLTDYAPGTKMLDLERSTEVERPPEKVEVDAGAHVI